MVPFSKSKRDPFTLRLCLSVLKFGLMSINKIFPNGHKVLIKFLPTQPKCQPKIFSLLFISRQLIEILEIHTLFDAIDILLCKQKGAFIDHFISQIKFKYLLIFYITIQI